MAVLGAIKTLKIEHARQQTPALYSYRYSNQVPIRDTQPALLVHWCERTVTRQREGQVLYHNAFITDHRLTEDTVSSVVAAGRSRWKTENENHNVLKTKGYHLEHNFGHGQQHLASVLLTLNLLDFLFHPVLHLVDTSYQRIASNEGLAKASFKISLASPSTACSSVGST